MWLNIKAIVAILQNPCYDGEGNFDVPADDVVMVEFYDDAHLKMSRKNPWSPWRIDDVKAPWLQDAVRSRILERDTSAPATPVVFSEVSEARGVKTVWLHEVEYPDLTLERLLCDECRRKTIAMRDYLIADDMKITARVEAFHDRHGIPGVVAWDEEVK